MTDRLAPPRRSPAAAGHGPNPALTSDDPAALRTRRRFARRQWRRRWVRWRYLLTAVVLIGLIGGSGWLVFASSYLRLHTVTVSGASLLSQGEVRTTAALPQNEPLATLDLDAARARIAALAPIRSVTLTREWPDTVRVSVVERTAVAVVSTSGGLRGIDASGVLFRTYRQAPPQLPRIETAPGIGTAALSEAAAVVAAMPVDLAALVDHVEVETVDQITVDLRSGHTVKWGSADASAEKAQVVSALLANKELTSPDQIIDVSAPGQPTLAQRR